MKLSSVVSFPPFFLDGLCISVLSFLELWICEEEYMLQKSVTPQSSSKYTAFTIPGQQLPLSF